MADRSTASAGSRSYTGTTGLIDPLWQAASNLLRRRWTLRFERGTPPGNASSIPATPTSPDGRNALPVH